MNPDEEQYRDKLPADVQFVALPPARQADGRRTLYPEVARKPEELHLRDVWRIVRKRWWMVIAIPVIVTSVVTIQMFRIKPLYEATASIEISRDNGTRVSTGEVFTRDDDDLNITMNTSQLMLKSDPLLEDVAAQLHLDQTRGFFDVTQEKSVSESLRDIAAKIVPGKIPRNDHSSPSSVVTITTTKAKAGKRTQEEADLLAPYVAVLASSLDVRPIRDTRVMTIGFSHTDPAVAANVANAVATRFVETSFNKKIENVASALEWLEGSTKALKNKIERAEQALADYTKANNIYAVDGKQSLIMEKLSHLHDQASRAEMERILKGNLYQQVLKGEISQVPEAFADPHIVELQKKLGELQLTVGELTITYGPKYSRVAEIYAQMAVIGDQITASRNLLGDKVKADYERAVQDEAALNDALTKAKGEASQENQSAIQYSFLKQDVDTSKALYSEFLQKTSQADLEVAQQHSNIRIIANASVPKGPVSPNRQRTILVSFLVSLAGGIGLAWLLERSDDSIRNVGDVNRFTPFPALAVIPVISAGRLGGTRKPKELRTATLGLNPSVRPTKQMQRARLMEFDGTSPAAEAYRGLRTSLLLSANGNPAKTILVTSARQEEGKTTTAANIAISLAQLGASVVLMDCDLRKPSIHGVFGLSNRTGLSTYLAGNGEVDDVIQNVPAKDFRLIPAGPNPPNPSELLSSERMKRLLVQLAERFDHVVIDSPPMGSVTDPVILSTVVDGVVLVVHGARNSRQGVQRACYDLSAVGARILGIVLNNVNVKREGYDNYYYSSHSYGYTPDDRGSKN